MFSSCLGEGYLYIPVFACEYIGGDFIYLFGDKGSDLYRISIDENEGVPGFQEQGIPKAADPVAGDPPYDGVAFFYKHRSLYLYFPETSFYGKRTCHLWFAFYFFGIGEE